MLESEIEAAIRLWPRHVDAGMLPTKGAGLEGFRPADAEVIPWTLERAAEVHGHLVAARGAIAASPRHGTAEGLLVFAVDQATQALRPVALRLSTFSGPAAFAERVNGLEPLWLELQRALAAYRAEAARPAETEGWLTVSEAAKKVAAAVDAHIFDEREIEELEEHYAGRISKLCGAGKLKHSGARSKRRVCPVAAANFAQSEVDRLSKRPD